ncbi:RrF2 family transcriptional regulator [[Ruminococcus] torques]|jgi:Rrf2 family cysteine metabolism transcriptional repressor|uniref:RrF2 family transcriptional regulator n=1 Tax=[Ruminococcus] torques TaxID=33039 RepID=UPI0015BC2838|nr:Rrf2 family transcriptional regulator [[Ruminococcus] torques]MBS5399041.1 Rrf2 family transcriptional regulator [Lachnospiraceae bacterium]MDM8235105.1 Rrf2 family transcriptional regulator [[Ruminococcus] torques]HJC80572.1 Rrf2 family transcriptional regulator [Candidatus Mediterraneibacter excrementipullorum]
MKLSTKGRYGLRALVDLAANEAGEAVSLAQTAKRQKLSLNYLEQVFGMLRRAGIVVGVKGSNGGFRLARSMDDITVKEILEALEGKFSIADGAGEDTQDPVQNALRDLLWDEIDRKINQFLREKTLGSLVREYRRNLEKGTIMYYI